MEPTVLLLVLCAAVTHASWNALVKMGGDPLVRMTMLNLVCGLIALPLLPFFHLPAPEAWPYLALSVAIHTSYYLLLVLSYRFGDLSFAYPVARGSAPLVVAVLSFVFAGERLSATGIVAVSMICVAIFSLALGSRRNNPLGFRPAFYALMTGVAIGGYTISDGLGARASGDSVGYVLSLFILEVPPLLVFTAWRRGTLLLDMMKANLPTSFLAGALAFSGYGIVVWALGRAPMTFVSALRETSVIVAALIGSKLLREPFGRQRIFAAMTVAAGVILLHSSAR